MSWTSHATNIHRRPLTALELASIIPPSTREHIKIHTVISFTSPSSAGDVTAAFADAWQALRLLKSPDVATTVADGYKEYKVPSRDELRAWQDATFRVATPGASVQAVVRDVQTRADALPMCYLLRHEAQRDVYQGSLILFISHWRTEATGAFRMLDQMFAFAADLLDGSVTRKRLSEHRPGDEVRLLTPDIETILMPDRASPAESTARVAESFAEYKTHLPALQFPHDPARAASPPYFKLHQRRYTTACTAALVRACKTNNFSVTAALNSAYIAGLRSVADPATKTRPWTCMMPAETRKRLPASSPFRDQGCWAAAQMLLLTVPADEDFVARARTLRRQYAFANDDTWLFEDAREVNRQVGEFWGSEGAEGITNAWFTSLGVLDGDVLVAEHGGMRIGEVTAWADDPTGTGVVFRMWTFRGRLTVHFAWNGASHGEEIVRRVMDVMEAVLGEELGVEMSREEDAVLVF